MNNKVLFFILTYLSTLSLCQEICYLPKILNCPIIDLPCENYTTIIGQQDTYYQCDTPLNLTAQYVQIDGGQYLGGLNIWGKYIDLQNLTVIGDTIIQCQNNITFQGISNISGLLMIGQQTNSSDTILIFQDTQITTFKLIAGIDTIYFDEAIIQTTSKPCLYQLIPITQLYKCSKVRSVDELSQCLKNTPATTLLLGNNIHMFQSSIKTTISVININQDFHVQNSIINSTASACKRNMGLGKGLEAQLKDNRYCTSGAAGAGYGTLSKGQCYLLTQYFMFLTHSFPYFGKGNMLSTGSGGYGYGYNTLESGDGGGIIMIYTKETISVNNSKFLAQGGCSGGNVYQSAGSGGIISIYSDLLTGQNSLFSASGGPSYNNNGSGSGGVAKISPARQNFTQTSGLYVNITQGYQPNNSSSSFKSSNGIFYGIYCKPGEYNDFLFCKKCPANTYNILGSSTCLPCPQISSYKMSNQQGISSINQCFNTQSNNPFEIWISPGLLDWKMMVLYIIVLFFFLILGLILKKKYKKKLSVMETQQFSLEQAKNDAQQDPRIVTQNLKFEKTIKFEDLLFHVHRITLIGRNTPHSPWMLPQAPPQQIKKYILLQGFMDFSYKFNRTAKWSKLQKILSYLLLLIYPLYWLYHDYCKKTKYKKLLSLFQQSKQYNLLNNYDFEDKNTVTIKISKNTDYTICYIDFIVYEKMDPKYFNLSVPFIICLSGEGNFLRPFYLQDRDVFFNCLFYIINRTKQKLQQQRGNTSQKLQLFSNLVSQKKRQQNNALLIKFLKNFNKIAMTLDLSSPINKFIELLSDLIVFLKQWNLAYFNQASVQIELILMISKIKKTRIMANQIHILTNKNPQNFRQFIKNTLPSMNHAHEYDLKLGLFVYNPDQQIQQNRKSDLKHGFNSGWVAQQMGLSEQQSIHEAYIGSQSLEQQQAMNRNKKIQLILSRLFMFLRYHSFTHRKFYIDVDNLKFYLVSVILCQALFVFVWSISFELPYVGVNLVSPFIGLLFVVSNSYGIGKLFLVLNAMSLLDEIITLIIQLAFLKPGSNQFLLNLLRLILCQTINIICNILVIQLGTRYLTVSRKLSASKMFK